LRAKALRERFVSHNAAGKSPEVDETERRNTTDSNQADFYLQIDHSTYPMAPGMVTMSGH
jgi:hypothetical protein